MKRITKVIKAGDYWRIQVFQAGAWLTMRDLYRTRAQARADRYWWA